MSVFNRIFISILRRYHHLTVAMFFAAALLSPGNLNSTSAANNPVEVMVENFGNQVLEILRNQDTASQQKIQFSEVFLENAEMVSIARFTLGKYARRVDEAQLEEYHQLLSRYIVELFVVKMRGTQSLGLEALSTTILKENKDYLVKSVINMKKVPGSSNAPIPVKWRIHLNDDKELKLFDINIGGFWLAQEQRSSFVDIISKNRGKIGALFDYLKKEVSE